jgi:NADH-quinone oxidoreductase subunit N
LNGINSRELSRQQNNEQAGISRTSLTLETRKTSDCGRIGIVNDTISKAVSGFVPQLFPEMILALAACVLFLGATFKVARAVWGWVALFALTLASVGLVWTSNNVSTIEQLRAAMIADPSVAAIYTATLYSSPLVFTKLVLLFKILALLTGFFLVLFGWEEGGDDHAGEYHGCLLLLVCGMCLVPAANDLITLFLALELISIPTYILLYLPKTDEKAQEAALKYFMLSIFSSALMLFGFSYLYGLAGTTNIPAIVDILSRTTDEADQRLPWIGVSLMAVVMVVAGLGFRITAVPFHFYAPDVYEGTTTPMAALLSFVPKVVGFAALLRVLGYVPGLSAFGSGPGQGLSDQVPMLLWIMAATTMTMGNVLALLQDNIRRMFAYSSVAHAGYMLIGLAVAPFLVGEAGSAVGGIEALLFYLLAYGSMTLGAFAVLHWIDDSGRKVTKVDDLVGLSSTHPGLALVMVLFLFSLIGIPLTAGFAGKFLIFYDALGLRPGPGFEQQATMFRILAFVAAINAAIGAWYYLRIAATMYLREPVEPLPAVKSQPVGLVVVLCGVLTLVLGVYPKPILDSIGGALRTPVPEQKAAMGDQPQERELAER